MYRLPGGLFEVVTGTALGPVVLVKVGAQAAWASNLGTMSASTEQHVMNETEKERKERKKVERYMAAHDAAVSNGLSTYKDPDTGYSVFTELAHKKRGTCCGNKCRHCPFGHINVKGVGAGAATSDRTSNKESS